MTDPFMRVDVSQTSRDFQPVALEPGLPLLDRSNSNGQTLRKWLGSFLAEPERVGDRVGFYVRDDEGRRIDSVFCVPVSDKDLAGELSNDFQELQRRISSATPQSPNEQLIHRIVGDQLRHLSDDANARDRRCTLFKFRDGKNKLHLVWSPGYRRRDTEPAAPLICTNPACSHLFLQRRDVGARCPVCQAVRKETAVELPNRTRRRFPVLLLLLLLLGLAGAFFGWQRQQGNNVEKIQAENLTVEPSEWSGPMGSQVQFVVKRHDAAGPVEVTSAAAVTVSNPKVLSIKPYENVGKALSPGRAEVTFFVGDFTAKATVRVDPRTPPVKLILQPDKLELGVGTTAQFKLLAEYEGGRQADVTDDAEWDADNSSNFFVHKGQVEGEELGSGLVHAQYRSDESQEPLEATAEVNVRDFKYKALKLSLDPHAITLGRPARVHVVATTDSGTEFSVDDSKDLIFETVPADRARIRGTELTPVSEGDLKLTARFQGLTDSVDTSIGKSVATQRSLDVSPRKLDLKVGEMTRLNVLSSQPDTVQVKSMLPEVVEVTSDGRVIGRQAGSTELRVTDASGSVKIAATVNSIRWQEIILEPPLISVRIGESATARIYGVPEDGNPIELAPDLITWAQLPSPELVDFDRTNLEVTGVRPTGARPERMTARLSALEASAEIEVVAPPIVLTLSPEGSMEIPMGQKRMLQVRAQSGGTNAVNVPENQIEWRMSPNTGFVIDGNKIHPTKENAQMRLTAIYQGATSNEIQVSSVASTPLTLSAASSPSSPKVGDTGVITVSAAGPGGPVLLDEEGMRFTSSDSKVLKVDPTTGAFRAIATGKATIQISHGSARQPANVTLTVNPSVPTSVGKPASLRLVSSQANPIKLPVGAEFSDWRVEAVADDGTVTNFSDLATLVVGEDSAVDTLGNLLDSDSNGVKANTAVVISNSRIAAVKAGNATVQAVYGGIRTKTGLKFEVADALDIDEIQLSPDRMNLLVGESASLSAEGFKDGKSVGDITNHPKLVWNANNEDAIHLDGPHLTASKPGTSLVSASVGSATSKPASVTVVTADDTAVTPAVAGRLIVVPDKLKMRVGDVAYLGDEIVVRRQQVDFSDTCDVAPPPNRVVSYDAEERSFHAVSPGRTKITFIVRDQSAVMDVDVEPAVVPDPKSVVVVEPSTGRVAVGEHLILRAYTVAPDGTRRAVSATFVSDAPDIAGSSSNGIQGIKPGRVTIEARVPGIDQSGKAQFDVENRDFERLVFRPAQMKLAVGQQKSFKVFGVTSNGRVELAHDPDLKLEVSDTDKAKISLSAANRKVQALGPGDVSIKAKWKGHEKTLPISSYLDSIDDLVITPDVTSIAEGASVDYQVFARRTGRLQPLLPDDGVELTVANPVIADSQESPFHVKGLKSGKTQVTAQYGSYRAVSQLTVDPRRVPVAPVADGESLRFVTIASIMDLTDPGDRIRVAKVLSDGTEQDVDNLVKLTVRDPQDVAEIDQTADGPVVRPKKIGQTLVDASLGDLSTQTPMLVYVGPRVPRDQEMRVSPSSLYLRVGETKRFSKAEILHGSGGDPISVPFQVTAEPNNVIEVLPDGTIKGMAPGNAVVTLTANDPDGKYSSAAKSASVQVGDLSDASSLPDPLKTAQNTTHSVDTRVGKGNGKGHGAGPGAGHGTGVGHGTGRRPGNNGGTKTGSSTTGTRRELVLSGPTETNVGADVQMRVKSVVNGQSSDVTDRAQMVLVAGDEALAEARPGSVIRAKAPGRIQIQARLDDLTSAPHELQIRPIAKFERLELEIAQRRMTVGEQRSYKIWGYPRGGGARQDLTRLVSMDLSAGDQPSLQLKTLEPNSEAHIVEHRPGSIIGKQAGRFNAQARLGDDLKSEQVTLDIVGDVPSAVRMQVQPSRIDLRMGDETPPIEVQVVLQGDSNFRTIDPSLVETTSSDPEVLKLKEPGLFSAIKPGQTRIKVTYEGMEQTIPVTVKFNPFASIEISSDPKFDSSTMSVDLTVIANSSAVDLDYRTLLPGSHGGQDDESKWVRADKDGNQSIAKLHSPKIPLVKSQNFYSVVIESKNLKTGEIEKLPFQFRLVSTSSKPAVTK